MNSLKSFNSKIIQFNVDYWIDFDMENIGILFENCEDAFKIVTKNDSNKLNIVKFINLFMQSKTRMAMENGSPKMLSSNYCRLMTYVIEIDLNNNWKILKLKTNETNDIYKNSLYWVGQTYSYISCRSLIPFRFIHKLLTLEDMEKLFITGHQLSFEGFYDRIKHKLI